MISALRLLKPTGTSIVRKNLAQVQLHRSFCADTHDDFKPQRKEVPSGSEDVMKLIEDQVSQNPIMLYMKGTPSQPQCGFSLQAVRILNAVGADFSSVNVLEYPAIREGIKSYS